MTPAVCIHSLVENQTKSIADPSPVLFEGRVLVVRNYEEMGQKMPSFGAC